MRYKEFEGTIEELVEQKLREIEEKEQVRILHAVESGSRAWGFASPDSDYDVRFIYVRDRKEYLKLQNTRDVIEWELDETLDINGWDLKKALIQYHRSNASLFEWAGSPVVYRTTKEWAEIHKQAASCFSLKASMYHYYGTAKSNYLEYLQLELVKYKKYFYVLRPILALQWLEERKCPPPVLFEELLNQKLDENVREAILKLMEIKTQAPESKEGASILHLNQYIEERIAYYKKLLEQMADDRTGGWEQLNQLFFTCLSQQKKDKGTDPL